MKKSKFLFGKLILTVLMLTLTLCASGLVVPKYSAKADSEYTVTFKNGDGVIKQMTVSEGGCVKESDLPTHTTHASTMPTVGDNEYYKWFYSANGGQTLFRITITNNADNEVIKNIKSDVIVWIKVFADTSDYHEVTFLMPDSTKVTKRVPDGGTVDEPLMELGFCERAKYDKSLENITSDTVITVTIDNTYKYIFVVGCLTALVTSLVVIVVIVFRMLRVPDDDDDDELTDELAETNE